MEKLAILDCGGQYTKVIDRKVRELGVKSDIFPIHVEPEALQEYQGIILSGGPESIWSDKALRCNKDIFVLQKPILGICYGMQLINDFYGGQVSPRVKKEFGQAEVMVLDSCPLFVGLEEKQRVLMSHGDSVDRIADGFSVCAKDAGGFVAGIYDEKRKAYGVQFHPEVDLTENGLAMLKNFLRVVCGLTEEYSLDDRVETSIAHIRKKVKDGKVIVLVSGGVDSAVTAVLLLKALDPANIYAIHVDHGFMRKNESDIICESLKKLGLVNLLRINGKDIFLNEPIEIDGQVVGPLNHVTDPEVKRNIIGHAFIKVLQNACDELHLDFDQVYLAQGTLRPDLIESGNPDVSVYAHKIKTHHNDVDIIRRAREKGMVVETNWDWHKDEVRQVARMLGLEEQVAARQPFPGPGLAVRVLCQDKYEPVDEQQNAELEALLSGYGYQGRVLPIQSVGVQGDMRSFGKLAVICNKEDNFGTGLQAQTIQEMAKKITDTIPSVNRVVLVLNQNGSAELDKIVCHPMYMNEGNLDLLRELDHCTTTTITNPIISQTFSVLLPMGITKPYSVVVRTFVTNDFMTGRSASIAEEIPLDLLDEFVGNIKKQFGDIEFVLFDITGKPPATCEWQ